MHKTATIEPKKIASISSLSIRGSSTVSVWLQVVPTHRYCVYRCLPTEGPATVVSTYRCLHRCLSTGRIYPKGVCPQETSIGGVCLQVSVYRRCLSTRVPVYKRCLPNGPQQCLPTGVYPLDTSIYRRCLSISICLQEVSVHKSICL